MVRTAPKDHLNFNGTEDTGVLCPPSGRQDNGKPLSPVETPNSVVDLEDDIKVLPGPSVHKTSVPREGIVTSDRGVR